MWDSIVQITPNDVGTNKGPTGHLDIKVAQLINALGSKPLLIEKLVINQTQGLLLKLSNENQQVNLQLPLKLSELFDQVIRNNSKLLITISSKQQVRLTPVPPPITQPDGQIIKPILFKNATLLKDQLLKLETPNISTSVAKSLNGAGKTINEQAASGTKHTNNDAQLNQQAKLALSKEHSSQLNTRSFITPLKNIKNAIQDALLGVNSKTGKAHSTEGSAVTLNQKEPAIAAEKLVLQPGRQNNAEQNTISVASAAKQILRSHFSKQLPLSEHINRLIKTSEIITKSDNSHPLIIKLKTQVNQLISTFEKNNSDSATLLKQRIEHSGHLLEKNLKQLKPPVQELPSPSKNESSPIAKSQPSKLSNQYTNLTTQKLANLDSQPAGIKTKQTVSTQQIDVKLLLLRISATIERIVKISQQTAINNKTDTTTENKQPTTTEPNQKLIVETALQLPSTKKIINQAKNQFVNQQILFKQVAEMLPEVRNMIAQIESNQLLSLKNEVPNLHQFLVDLPIKNQSQIDSFEMLFERTDTPDGRNKVKHWKVVVRFDLEPLGPMFARIELENDRISTHFFAQAQQTAALISEHMHVLKQSLFSAGVKVDKLEGSQGKIPETLIKNDVQLVDTHV